MILRDRGFDRRWELATNMTTASKIVLGTIAIILLSLGVVSASDRETDWPKWRGPQDNGSAPGAGFPVAWKPADSIWKVALGGKGCSTPVVDGRQIFVTAPTAGRDALLAFDLSGKRLWCAEFDKEVPGRHRNGSGCNASPVTDGKRVFVYFKSGTFAAVNFDGKILWQSNLIERFGPEVLYWDHGTSPVVTKKHVVMTRMHHGESWLAAFDKTTGKIAWKVSRNFETPREGDHGYATPLVIEHEGEEALLVWGAQHVTLHRSSDGGVIWTCGGFNPEGNELWPSVASPVVCGDYVIVPFGRNDRGSPRLHGIRLGGRGDVTKTHRAWKRDDIGTFVPTPAAHDGKVYLVGDKGRVTCLDPATGKSIWSDSFPKHRKKFYASPLIADGKLYAPREDGVVFVASIKDRFQLLAENDMEEPVIASPIPSGRHLLIRGTQTLFCLGTE